ncbi:uncharacterized protein LOC129911866 [Episyrphus balteatus]|uniref:uncharacterized protein LOC129911866 n=1 Tax=Episyrphus balteatus TaxID=286459 RepID=UPI002485FD67|nr:uncharacterized protein LOC129911866 [Episyrphus balteatus]
MSPKYCYVLLALIVVLSISFTEIECKRVIFYNSEQKVQEGNLFISVERSKPCAMGMKRDHNDRCRRVVNYLKKRNPRKVPQKKV